MKKTNKLISILLVLAMLLSMAPIAVFTASAASAPSYSTTSEGVRLYANGTNLFIEAGTASGTAVYYMNGSTKTYVNPNGAKGNDLSNSEIYMGTASSNDDYLDVSLVMTGGEVGTIYTAKSYGYLIGNVTVAVTGTAKAGLIWCGSKYGPDSGQDLHGKNGNLAIFNTVGAEIRSGSTDFDGMIKYTESGWEISGNAVIPEGATMTVAAGQTVTVPADAAVVNNGALVNNGTLELYGAVTGNNIAGNGTINCYADYIENVSTVSSVSAKVNGESVVLANGQYRLSDGMLYIWLPDGNAEVILNNVKYYGTIIKGSPKKLGTAYTAISSITGIPSEIDAYITTELSPMTNQATFVPEFSYEILTDGTTAPEARVIDSSIYAAGAGVIKLKATASDGYSSYSKVFDITVKDSGYAASVTNGSVTISKYSDTQLKVTHSEYTGGYILINKDDIFIITGTSTSADNVIIVESGDVNIVLKDCNISFYSLSKQPLSIASGVKVKLIPVGTSSLANEATRVSNSNSITTAINVPKGAELIIDGPGTLNATGGQCSAAIGTHYSQAPGTITINGGTINATSGSYAAAIGSGGDSQAKNNYAGGTITINGGTVNAISDSYGAGIGGGMRCDGGTITINGGTVTAESYTGAGIGGGGAYGSANVAGNGGEITINGGTVIAKSTYYGAGIGSGYSKEKQGGDGGTIVINGGNIKATSNGGEAIGKGYNGTDSGTLKNADGNDLTLNTITLSGAEADSAVTKIEGINYGLTDVKTLDTDKLYFWLPANTAATSITAGGNEYICNGNLTYYTAHSWANNDGICANGCGYECPHENQTGETCEICGASLHTHSFTYSASGDTITAVCANTDGNCPDSEGTLTILAPADLYVDGTAKEATVENSLVDTSVAVSDITYSTADGSAPKTEGTYTASVTVGGATATVEFTLLNYAATVTDKDGNAVGTYKTFAEAITAASASEGSTVTLLDDVTLTAEQNIRSGKFTLDLNGKTLINETGRVLYIYEEVNLTIKDSGEGGTLERTDTGGYAIKNNGTLTVESGIIKGDGGIDNKGTLTFKDGTAEAVTYPAIYNTGTAYVYDGVLKHAKSSALGNYGTLYVYDGEIDGIVNDCDAYISGGKIDRDNYAALNLLGGTVEITGGSFTGTDLESGYYSGTPYGEFTVYYSEGATLTLKGGEFPNGFVVNNTTANALLAEGYYYKDADGKLITVADDAKKIDGYVKVSKGADLSEAVITVDKTEFVYNGQHQAAAVTVTIGGKTLTENVDYVVNARRWENGVPVQWFYYVDAGVYTSVITGLGDYTGKVEKEFVIKPATVDIIWEGDEFYYTGNPHKVAAKYIDVNGDEIDVASITNGENTEIGKYIATATVEDSNYAASEATTIHTYEIKWYDGAPDAEIGGVKGENGWYTRPVIVTAPDGYVIDTLVDGTYGNTITFVENEENAVYYLKQTENGYIAKVELGEIKVDLENPTAEITVGENKWNSFLNTVTFGKFFKQTQSVTIEASDETSGVAKVEYVVATEEITDFESVEWLEYTGKFNIEPNSKNIIYAKATDNAGRYVIVNSEGIVLYTDSTLDTSFKDEVVYVLTKNADQAFNLNLNGNTVAYVKIDETVLDVEDYEVLGNMVLVSAAVLENYEAGEYTITVGFNPMGEVYVEGDAPAEVTIPLTVKKADVTIEISDFGKVYDGKPVTAEYKISKSSDSSPAVSNIKYNETVEYKVKGADDSTYTTEAPVNAGEYTVRITVAQTDKISSAQVTADFTIEKKAVTVTATAPDKVYDGTTDILEYSKVIVKFDGAVEGEMLGFTVGKAWYDTSDAGTDKTVHIIYAPVASNNIDNYEFPMNPEYSTDNCYVAAKAAISRKDISDGFIILGEALTYNGKEQTQTVEKVLATGTAPEVTYTVSGNKATNVGVYLLTVTGTGNFTGEAKIAYEIAPDTTGIDAVTVENVTSADKTDIEAVKAQIDNAVTDIAVDEIKAEYKAIADKCDELLAVINDTADEIERVENASNAYDEDTVKSTDKEAIEQLKDDIQALIDSGNVTEEEKTALEEKLDKAEALTDKIAQTEEQLEKIAGIENGYNPETVTSDDKAAIEDAIAAIEAVNPDNLTDEQREEYDEIKAGFEVLLEEIAAAEKDVADIGVELEMFDEKRVTIFWEDDIEALKAKIDELLADENMGEAEKAKLNEYKAQVEKLIEIINDPCEYFSLRFFYFIWDCLTWKWDGLNKIFEVLFGFKATV